MSDAETTEALRTPVPARPRPAPRAGVRGVLGRAAGTIGSFGFAVVLLLLLMGNVLYGTFAQGWMSLYEVQERYFDAWVSVFDVYGVPVPWPGAMLSLGLLSVNMVVGGVIRIRKSLTTVGVVVAHCGVLLLFCGSLVESLWSQKGQLTVWEGDAKGEFQSYDEWEIVVRERRKDGGAREWILGAEDLRPLDPDDLVRFTHADLPFDVAVTGWERNSEPRMARRGASSADTADGWVLEGLATSMQNENNLPGAWVTLVPKGGGPSLRTILWGGQSHFGPISASQPWVASVAARRFEVDLRTQRWDLPFRIELKTFVKRDYPGTSMPAEYSSYVRKHEDGTTRDVHITMNEPLRHRGYTLYQTNWGPQPPQSPGPPWFSQFAVVRNPSDRVPWISWFVIAAGLLLHFSIKLYRYLRAESVVREARRAS